jgi:predicted nucleic acid-binding protein
LIGIEEATAYLADARSRGDELWSVTVVRTEIFAGMLTREEKRTRAFLAEIGWIDVDQTLADLAGELARRYVKSHPSVDTVDYIVAAQWRLSRRSQQQPISSTSRCSQA